MRAVTNGPALTIDTPAWHLTYITVAGNIGRTPYIQGVARAFTLDTGMGLEHQ